MPAFVFASILGTETALVTKMFWLVNHVESTYIPLLCAGDMALRSIRMEDWGVHVNRYDTAPLTATDRASCTYQLVWAILNYDEMIACHPILRHNLLLMKCGLCVVGRSSYRLV